MGKKNIGGAVLDDLKALPKKILKPYYKNGKLNANNLGDGGDLVADEGCCLKFQPVRGFQHPLVEGFQNILFAVADEVDSAFDGLLVVFTAYLAG